MNLNVKPVKCFPKIFTFFQVQLMLAIMSFLRYYHHLKLQMGSFYIASAFIVRMIKLGLYDFYCMLFINNILSSPRGGESKVCEGDQTLWTQVTP